MKDRKVQKKEQSQNTNNIRNTRVKDSGAKLIFDNPILCAQFLRGYTDVDILKNVQPEDIEDVSERFLWMWQENRDSDSVKKIRLTDVPGIETIFLITLIEHQSKVDYDMSFRILRYIVQILTDYAEEQEKQHPGITKTKGFRYPPIIPIVFYDGPGNWTAEVNFREKVFLNDALNEFIPDFRYLVVPLSKYSDQELVEKGDELSLIMLVDKLKSTADFQNLREIPGDYFENIGKNSPESVLKLIGKIISVLLLKLNIPKEEVAGFTDQIERRNFAMLFENFEAYDVQETRRISKAEGKAESVLELLEDLGEITEELKKKIMSQRDMEILKKWHKLAARAESLGQFEQAIEELTAGKDDK